MEAEDSGCGLKQSLGGSLRSGIAKLFTARNKRAETGMAKRKIPNILGRMNELKLCRPGRLLVFESTGAALYGAVAGCGLTASFSLGEPAVSRAVDLRGAIGEVLEQLRRTSKRKLPKAAVLITPSAAARLLYLPVDPKKPRAKAQMSELVRWELEELLMQQGDVWSMGGLLMARGYLTPEQRHGIEGGPSADRRGRPGVGAYRDSVTGEQLQECQDLQVQLEADSEDLVTGYAPQAADEEEGRFLWLGAGIGDGICARWVSAFEKHGIFLSWIYPQLGTAASLLEQEAGNWLLVDIRQERFGLFQGKSGSLSGLALKPCSFGRADPLLVADAVQGMLHPDVGKVCVSASAGQAGPILAELKQRFGRETAIIPEAAVPAAEGGCPPEVRASLHGAARHGMGVGKPGSLVRIEARTPAPPLWKRREIYPWLVIGLLLVAIVGYEWSLRTRTKQNEWALEKADIEFDRDMKLKKEVQEAASEAKRLQAVLAAKEEELKKQKRLKDILDNVIRHRQVLVPGVLQAIGKSVSDGVMLDLLEEKDDRSGFYLEGWALKDTDGQLFANRLNENLASWDYKVGDMQLARGAGRLGIGGFVMKLWLVKTATPAVKKNA